MRTCIITHREKEDVFPEEFGPMYDTALQSLMWEFLSRLEKLLPTPTFQQTASWLRPAPSMLKECAQSVTQPQTLKTLLQHHRCHGHLFANGHSSCADDRILSSLSHTFSERIEMDIEDARSHCQSKATCAPRKERDTLIEQDNAEKELGMSLDTVKKAVEMTDRRNEEWREKKYEERLQHQLAYNVLQVEIVDGEDMSSTSSMTADDVGWTCWTPDETMALISVWSDEQILHKMEQSYRKKHVYREISECLKELGVKKTTKQCHNKIKALKWRYRETLRTPSSRPCPFFSQLHKFLAAVPESKETDKVSDGEVVSVSQDEGPSVDVELEHLNEEMVSRKGKDETPTREQTEERKRDDAFCSPQSESKMKPTPKKHCRKQMVEDMSSTTLVDNDTRTWTLEGTKALISVWSNKQVLQMMEQSYRKKHAYCEVSERLKNIGIKRTWKQCQSKIKHMKHSYRQALRNPSSSGRATCPFFSELHTFLAAMPDMPESKETGKVSDAVVSSDQDEGPSVDVELERLNEEMVSRKGKDETPTREQTEERKGDESDSRMNIGRKQAVEDVSDFELEPVVLQTQVDDNGLVTGGDPRPVSQTTGQSSKRSKRAKICSLCGKSFVEAKDLTTHMRTHTEQSPHQCAQCGEGFEHPDDLQKHWQNECEEMTNQQEVNEHQHGTDRISGESSSANTDPKTCHLCHKTFTFQYMLRRHLIVFHKGRRLFKCPLCLKGFAFLSALKKHQSNKRGCLTSEAVKKRKELGSKNPSARITPALSLNTNNPKTCPVCHATFSQTSSLKSHYFYRHAPDKSRFKCPRCLKAFVSHSQRKRHQQNKRGCRLERSHKHGSRPAWSLALRENKNEIPQPSSTATQEPTTSQVPTTAAQSFNKKTIPKACPVCQKTFKFEATMVRHIASHQKESLNKCPDILKCTFCEEIFSQGMDLKSHYSRTHQFTGPFPCPSCQKTFVSLTELHLHQRNESTPYQCSVCQRLFRTQYTLTIHERIHTGEKPFLCAECGKGFRSEKLLQSHSKSHVEGKPHSCSTCGKRFQRRELLKQHMLHHKDAAFICPDCGKKFFQLVWLRRHMLMHTGERPFLCDLCGKGFKSTAELRIHTRTHTGERPFKCQECGKGCRQKSELQEHLRRHTGERPYPCTVCDKCFYVSKDRKRHMLIHTGEKPFKCQVCGMAFNRRTLLRVHQKNKLCLYTSPLHYTPLHYTSL
uniref:C2H2-type domain-containing protein n=1 Tax=Hucho hucho TaxID=62062 RepID=A0A4W5PH76_9TELE